MGQEQAWQVVQDGRREERGRSGRLPRNATPRGFWDSRPLSCVDNHLYPRLPSGQGLNASAVTAQGRGEDSEGQGGSLQPYGPGSHCRLGVGLSWAAASAPTPLEQLPGVPPSMWVAVIL